MAGPRLTAPAAKQLARSVSTTTHSGALPAATTIATSSRPAPLSRKYADLLKEKSADGDHPRHMYTRSANRPHPAPRRMRLMQTFTSSASQSTAAVENPVGFTPRLPSHDLLALPEADPFTRLRVPILPDNYTVQHAPEASDLPVAMPVISVVAADPERVEIAALTEVEGIGIDGVELSFAHQEQPEESEPNMLSNIWQGLMDDVLGAGQGKGKLSM